MLVKEKLTLKSAILIYLSCHSVRPIMKFGPNPLIGFNFHGPLVTILTGLHCIIMRAGLWIEDYGAT